MPADTPTPGDSGAPLDLESIRHRLSEVRGARAGRWDFHRAIGSTLTFNAHAARDVEVLLAEVDRLTAEHTTHLLGVGHPMWLPSVADALDHPDPFNAPPDDVLDRVRAMVAERDELAATLANERGEGEPPSEGWARNDIDPKREGVAWYVRWEADGSEPQDDDTEQTRVAWVRRTEGCMIEWMWEIEKSVGRMSDPMLASGRAPTARDAMIAADAARGGR